VERRRNPNVPVFDPRVEAAIYDERRASVRSAEFLKVSAIRERVLLQCRKGGLPVRERVVVVRAEVGIRLSYDDLPDGVSIEIPVEGSEIIRPYQIRVDLTRRQREEHVVLDDIAVARSVVPGEAKLAGFVVVENIASNDVIVILIDEESRVMIVRDSIALEEIAAAPWSEEYAHAQLRQHVGHGEIARSIDISYAVH
jgi:hypothetical protein